MSANGHVVFPIIKSQKAKSFAYATRSHTLNQVQFGYYVPKCGDYRVKSRTGGNHVDVFVSWDTSQQAGWVIGGNVNDKVSVRMVTLQSMVADGTTALVEVDGFYNYRLTGSDYTSWLRSINEKFQIVPKVYYEATDEQQLKATWYGKAFDGKRTANGEIYDMTKLTAAHKTLPFGTMLYVFNAKNGKSVIVRINDRCPKVGILDLAKAAADTLKLTSAKVTIWKLTKKELK
jgi:hypothetical protein